MLTLALDTSSRTESIALLKDRNLLAELSVEVVSNHSESLLPSIKNLLDLTPYRLSDVDLFALTIGPGSFTGLRIGASTVKGLSLALGKPVAAVSTLEALAYNVMPSSLTACPFMDAKRNEVYTAVYRTAANGLPQAVYEEAVVNPEEFLKSLKEDTVFVGDGTKTYAGLIKALCPVRFFFAPPHLHLVRASAVGILGMERFKEGLKTDTMTFTPRYLRLSQAEVKFMA